MYTRCHRIKTTVVVMGEAEKRTRHAARGARRCKNNARWEKDAREEECIQIKERAVHARKSGDRVAEGKGGGGGATVEMDGEGRGCRRPGKEGMSTEKGWMHCGRKVDRKDGRWGERRGAEVYMQATPYAAGGTGEGGGREGGRSAS
ncbi:hypothetical protein B0H14DRAFT_2601027 [Mycena olivaceomarginata]|nr:hypothetical protein B0H14DRAFT_2601027 [Mycena olivaceomarginata]